MNFKKYCFNFLHIFCIFLIISFLLPISLSFGTENLDNVNVDAPVALLMDANTGKILYEKNIHDKMYPASTTKIMTAILALENRDLSHVAKVSYNAIFTVPAGYSHANLKLDEELTMEQLLNVLLIPSANDAANVIAEDIGGSVESFVSMMNTKAIEIGCFDTHFVNANGVHDENHYSTAYDLAIMGKYAMKNETFRKIVNTVRYTLPVTNKYDKANRTFLTTNNLINSKNSQYYEYATGLKTGYTDPAKNCIVASAKKDDLELICVIMGADNTADSNKFNDCISLFNYGFTNYAYKKLFAKDSVYKVVTPRNASSKTKNLNLLVEDDINVLVKMSDYDMDFVPDVNFNDKFKAPIAKDSVVGTISYDVYGIKYTTNLIAGQDIEANSVFVIIFKIVFVIFAILILKRVLNLMNSGKKRKWKKKKKKKSNSSYSSPYKFRY